MKVLLDANVLYPNVMRDMLLGVAQSGAFIPVWSPRILEEWARAAAKLGQAEAVQARGEITLLNARWPKANISYDPHLETRLWLPDRHDVHVLAAAIASHADAILTMNAKDFPKHILAEDGLQRLDPDGFLCDLYLQHPDAVMETAQGVLEEAQRLSGEDWTIRKLMKKARLPRLGRALESYSS